MSERKPKLSDLEEMGRAAGEILRAGFGKVHDIDRKGVIDLVTEVDKEAEAFLLQQIEAHFPDSQAVGEEGGRLSGSGSGKWYIDPIDGTTNYAHGLPIFCVSIAYEEAGELAFGVVYNPIQEEFYAAERGGGAFLNGRPLQVNQVNEVANSLLVTGFPYDIRTNPDNNLAEYARFSLRTHGVRRLGAAALDLCYVAAGYFDGYWEKRLNVWDVAAGALVVREAGGKVTDANGAPDFMTDTESILAANPKLHSEMLKILQEED
jgi:myo-inositol-1(or 4)-monophosphatase